MEKIGILGIGKLGLCLALNFERVGYEVFGVDIDPDYVEAINNKSFQTAEPLVQEHLQKATRFTATTDLTTLIRQDDLQLLFILVATPNRSQGGYDHSQIEELADSLMKFGPRKRTIHLIIGSTTMPGYCDQLAERIKAFNYTLSYNPIFIAQGSIMNDLVNPDQVLIGQENEQISQKIQNVHQKICRNNPVIHRMDRISAEICKLATNCFLTTKISFANAIGDLAVQVGGDPEKILAAIGSDSRIGPKYLGYGYGYGGPCFPRDNRALGYYAQQNKCELPICQATDQVNRNHLSFQLQQSLKKFAPGETIEFDYITYKKESISLEESQQLALAVHLAEAGRSVLIRERTEVIDQLKQTYGDLFQYQVNHASQS